MKLKVTTLLILLALVFSVPVVQAKPKVEVLAPDELYTPDVKAEMFDAALETSAAIAAEAGGMMPFWADLVNKELVPNDGTGVYVAVLDTGLLDLWPIFFAGATIRDDLGIGFTHDVWWDDTLQDFVFGPLRDDRGFITDSYMGSGHGTHVTSTIIGYHFSTATADFWVEGIAPAVSIIPVLVLDAWEVPYPLGTARFTGGTDEMVSAGLYYVGDLAETLDGPVVINMSLGGGYSEMIEDAVDYAIGKGVIVVASAGNDGTAGMGYPGGLPQVISAAAGGWTEQWITRPPQTRWWLNDVPENLNTMDYWGNNWQIYLEEFSARPNKDLGQKNKDLDVTTPGASIVGPYKPYFSTVVGYYTVWGTSQAAPHVSGTAGLVLQSYPSLDQAAMETILKNAAHGLPLAADGAHILDPWGEWDYKWYGGDAGAGFLQADAALQVAGVHAK